jgi:hypothetical protein
MLKWHWAEKMLRGDGIRKSSYRIPTKGRVFFDGNAPVRTLLYMGALWLSMKMVLYFRLPVLRMLPSHVAQRRGTDVGLRSITSIFFSRDT